MQGLFFPEFVLTSLYTVFRQATTVRAFSSGSPTPEPNAWGDTANQFQGVLWKKLICYPCDREEREKKLDERD